jgi:hypothetical protein
VTARDTHSTCGRQTVVEYEVAVRGRIIFKLCRERERPYQCFVSLESRFLMGQSPLVPEARLIW